MPSPRVNDVIAWNGRLWVNKTLGDVFDIYELGQYGAIGDNSTDDTDAIQDAIDAAAAAGGGVVEGACRTYKVNSALVLKDNVTLQNMTLNFASLVAGGTAITATSTLGSAVLLTANLTYASRSLTVASTSGIVAGSWVLIYSDTLWGTTSAGVIGEITRVKSVDSGTTITLETPANNSYTTAANAAMQLLNEEVGHVRLRNVTMSGTGPGSTQTGIKFTHCVDVQLEDCKISLFDTSLVEFYGCVNGRVLDCHLREARRTGFAYGVLIQRGCRDILVHGCHMSWMRHGVTIGGTAWVNRFIRVSDCHFDYSVDGLDSHTNAQFVEFIGNVVNCSNNADISAATDGIIVECADFIISHNIVRYPLQTGIWWQNLVEGHATYPSGVITDNLIISPGTQGIYVQNLGQPIKGLTIANNVIQNVRGTGTGGIYVFADDFDIDRVAVTGNVLTECQNHGIQLRATDGALTYANVTGNQVEVTNAVDSADAVRVLTCDRVNITGNVLSVANTTRHGILTSESSELVIQGNNITLPTSASGTCINIGGTGEGMVVSGNRGINGATGLVFASTITASTVGENEFRDCTAHYDISSGTGNRVVTPGGVSDDNGDAAKTLVHGVDEPMQQWLSPISADRAVTLSSTGAYRGGHFHIMRSSAATGAFNLNVGTGPLKALAAGEWCIVARRASNWVLVAYGTL